MAMKTNFLSQQNIEEVKAFCSDLVLGETTRKIECPACGISNGDFTVTRTEVGLLYNCYRTSCGTKGFIPSAQIAAINKLESDKLLEQLKLKNKTNPYSGLSYPLVDSEVLSLSEIYNIPSEVIRLEGWEVSRTSFMKRLLLPIYNIRGVRIGVESKFIKGFSPNSKVGTDLLDKLYKTKSLVYWEKPDTEEFRIHFPKGNKLEWSKKNKEQIWCLVEDIPSACAMSIHFPTIALLGSAIPKTSLEFFKDKNVVFCLDNDATNKSIDLCNKYSLMFRSSQIIPLTKDPKNMTQNEIKANILERIEL